MLREMYYNERALFEKTLEELKENPILLEDFLHTVFNTDEVIVKRHKKRDFLKYFYLDGQTEEEIKKQVIPRRYWAKPEILGWDIFKTQEEASKLGQNETYEDYLTYIKKNVSGLKIARIVLLIANTIISSQEVAQKHSEDSWEEWVETCKIWYAYSFIHTVWNGKAKETFFEKYAKPEVAKYHNLKIVKTSVDKDMKFKIDYAILNTETKTPVASISIKGMSWFWANENSTSTYQAWGEKREKAGHKAFTKEYKVPVKIVVSEPIPGGQLGIVNDMRVLLQELEEAGKIERIYR